MSAALRLTIATGDYDITRPILDGQVTVQGIDAVGVSSPSPQRHWRMLMHREFDVAEMSLGSFSARVSRGQDDLVAIPVFPHRRFRHGYVFASAAAGVRKPEDLVGCTVGLRSWQTTAGVWLRGILDEYYGLPVESVRWLTQDREDVEMSTPDSIDLAQIGPGLTVTDACAQGKIEGLLYPEIPAQVLPDQASIVRVFDDPKAEEQNYYQSTSIFPIMHVVAIKAELVDNYPWLPRSLMELFEKAKNMAMLRLRDPRTVSLAWLRALQDEEAALLGPDPWRFGFDEVNRKTLDTFLRYAAAQGVTARRVSPGELFVPSTHEPMPTYV